MTACTYYHHQHQLVTCICETLFRFSRRESFPQSLSRIRNNSPQSSVVRRAANSHTTPAPSLAQTKTVKAGNYSSPSPEPHTKTCRKEILVPRLKVSDFRQHVSSWNSSVLEVGPSWKTRVTFRERRGGATVWSENAHLRGFRNRFLAWSCASQTAVRGNNKHVKAISEWISCLIWETECVCVPISRRGDAVSLGLIVPGSNHFFWLCE